MNKLQGLILLLIFVPSVVFADNGVTTTLTNEGVAARTVKAQLNETKSVKDFGAICNGVSDDTAAIQAGILASVGTKNLTQQPEKNLFELVLNGTCKVTTLYLPRFTKLRGGSTSAGFTSTVNAPILVLGRSLSESSWLDIELRDFQIHGDLTKTLQVAIKGSWTGAGAYIYPLVFENLYIRDIGGSGIEIVSDNKASMLIKTNFTNVQVVNTKGYGFHTKVGVFNAAIFYNGVFNENALGGVFIEDIGGGNTNPSEAIKFQNVQFESNGKMIGETKFGVGSFGFKSTIYSGQYSFDSCYFEGNGANPKDTTGASIWVRAPWMLLVTNSMLVASNNQIVMYQGGNAKIEGNFIRSVPPFNAIFSFDSPPQGTGTSSFDVGQNKYDMVYTSAKMFVATNAANTKVTGYKGVTNYLIEPPRIAKYLLRDSSESDANKGAIGYSAVKRLVDNANGSSTLLSNSVASICKATVNSLVIVTDNNSSQSALLFITPHSVVLIGQSGAIFTTAMNTAGKINIYYDAATSNYVLQNKTANSVYAAVRFTGVEAMMHSDDGYYETQF
jgi:hypothetical protein